MKKIILLLFAVLVLPFGMLEAANIDKINNNYAWGENIGWVDFSEVSINDEGEFLGYAYSSNTGWISMNCFNNDNCTVSEYKVVRTATTTVSGYAWGENIGWIDFGGVSINEAGDFTGYAYSPNIGYISFNCSNTDTCDDVDFKISLEAVEDENDNGTVDTPNSNDNGNGSSSRGRSGGSRRSSTTGNNAVGSALAGALSADTSILNPQENQPTGSLLDENRISTINMDLFLGMEHPYVKKLQILLNSLGYTLAESGAGSPGNETEYFGRLTQAALARYQKDNGIVPSVGYFGPITRAFLSLKGF